MHIPCEPEISRYIEAVRRARRCDAVRDRVALALTETAPDRLGPAVAWRAAALICELVHCTDDAIVAAIEALAGPLVPGRSPRLVAAVRDSLPEWGA